EQYMLLTVDGLVLSGLLHSRNETQVTIKTAEGVLRNVLADEIEELSQSDVSLMPAGLHQLLTVQELLDLVDYMVLLRDKSQRGFHVLNDETSSAASGAMSHALEDATKGLATAEGLKVSLFAGEPDLRNPSNIDVDHLGRVWVCEVINYRHFRNPYNPVRHEGDRILVLEDVDGDHVADKTTVFYQGVDVNSAHGICVLDDRVIVSAGDSVFALVDADGDLVAEDKQVLFTGIGGSEHDHGIHAVVPGPDGKLYFNFGNEGHQLKDAQGQPIVDRSGRAASDSTDPYQQGMVFRCDPDGSHVETLAWNFRNNWEVCVDSFGTMWQSDNDDDGNRATRINYVMPFGNYGYRSEIDGATWSSPRTGMHDEIPLRHWHLNDPGVVPNVVQTGAGSPTGIAKYEGDLLPSRFHHQLIHCDPGPNSVRAFELTDDGAGFRGKQVPLLTGAGDKWFRPVDVCVAPDGSLIVADWYDPGVGGHRMGDTDRGRIFRVAADSTPDSSRPRTDRAIDLLRSPNVSARYLGARRLRQRGLDAVPELLSAIRESASAPMRARALWVFADVDPNAAIERAMKDSDEKVRCMAFRLANQHLDDAEVIRLSGQAEADRSPHVRREAVLALRDRKSMEVTWAALALLHDGKDRWYLEALGIAAASNWDACIEAWLALVGDDWAGPAGRDIIWRSRAARTSELLAKLLTEHVGWQGTSRPLRYLRAFDFQPNDANKRQALEQVVRVVSRQTNRPGDLRNALSSHLSEQQPRAQTSAPKNHHDNATN
ncbi:MAG: PVC-type heme-binding CxxCH protein, partial [Planctomycetota bacterium]